MIPVFQALTLPEAEMCRQRLAEDGIEATIRNVHLQGAIGELPANLLPEVCVLQTSDFDAAREIVRLMEAARVAPDQAEKSCPACGELNPGNFELCWKCRAELEVTA